MHIPVNPAEIRLIFFKGKFAFFSMMFFLMGLLFLIGFSFFTDFSFYKYWIHEVGRKEAVITDIRGTNSYVNEERVMNYFYRYEIEGEKFTGNSFGSGKGYEEGDRVYIQYLVDNPGLSRIQGTRNAPFGSWILIFLMVFPTIGLIGIIYEGRRVGKILNILKDAGIDIGKKTGIDETNVELNEQTLYRITYEYTVVQRRYTCNHKSLQPHRFDKEVYIVYAAPRPSSAILLKALPDSLIDRIYQQAELSAGDPE